MNGNQAAGSSKNDIIHTFKKSFSFYIKSKCECIVMKSNFKQGSCISSETCRYVIYLTASIVMDRSAFNIFVKF